MDLKNLSKEEALEKLKEAKEHLELELINQAEYDELKEKLKQIIIGENTTGKSSLDKKTSFEHKDLFNYSFEDWFDFIEPINKMKDKADKEIVELIQHFIKNRLPVLNGDKRSTSKTIIFSDTIEKKKISGNGQEIGGGTR